MGAVAALLAGDPLGVAARGRDLAVQRHRGLEQHPRATGAGVLTKRLVQQPGTIGQLTVDHHDLDSIVAQDPQAAPGRVLARVV
jgi:hypothetical protein